MAHPLRAVVALFTVTSLVSAPAALARSGATSSAKSPHPPFYVRDGGRPLGVHDPRSPIKHVVIVMQENHSFDEYFGMLPREGQPAADGFSFNAQGQPTNSNPAADGSAVDVRHHDQICSGDNAGQSWDNSHHEIDGGRMDGFARINPHAMSYYTRADIPFYYSLATTFTLANRWFSSVPAQTYPNRRFLYAGTAYGNISTDTSSYFDPPPPNGTIMDEYEKYGVTWRDYVTDLPDTALIPSNFKRYPERYTGMAQFYADAKSGRLPNVSYVESDGGVPQIAADTVGGQVPAGAPQPAPVRNSLYQLHSAGGDEEDDDVRIGQDFVSHVVNSVVASPDWSSTLLIWLYDEHGGFYDHVSPPAAIKPDNIPPNLGPDNVPGGYDMYGVRVPAVVVSPWSLPHATTNVVHDHASVLAEIESLWNLPALTYRDANAATLNDFLDLTHPSLLRPPALAAPGNAHLRSCHAT
ncbi:MAG: alkaline phosphatase family protein [Actinomycetes bacterium]